MPTSATDATLAAIDIDYLDRVTFRDKAFRDEILTLFVREARLMEQRLKSAATEEDWRVAAHTLKGMSRGIGATSLATSAEQAERLTAGARKEALPALSQQIAEAIAASERLLSGR